MSVGHGRLHVEKLQNPVGSAAWHGLPARSSFPVHPGLAQNGSGTGCTEAAAVLAVSALHPSISRSAMAEDVNAMAASIKPKSVQMRFFRHYMPPRVRSGLSEAEYGLRKRTGRNWRMCAGHRFRLVFNRRPLREAFAGSCGPPSRYNKDGRSKICTAACALAPPHAFARKLAVDAPLSLSILRH